MQLLVLDFDGVISDSASESFMVALATYTSMRPDSTLCSSAENLMRAGLAGGLLARLQRDVLYRDFLELMPLGNRAEDFAVLLGILEERKKVEDQADYDRERAKHDPLFLEEFHERFYLQRASFSEADPVAWQRLLAPYPEFTRLLRARAGSVEFALATAKDRRSVTALLEAYEIADLFPSELVLDKETGANKCAHLEALSERTRLTFAEVTFVDDKVNHLDSVASLGVRCVLAAWGYNGERERKLARERGYLVCELADAEARIFG